MKRPVRGELITFFKESLKLETDECITWIYGMTSSGYGLLKIDGLATTVTRHALKAKVGPPPSNKPYALHSCNNPGCFNYRHLRWGDMWENIADRYKDGTDPVGSKNGNSVLTEEAVIRIRASKLPVYDLSKEYGVSAVTIRNVLNRKSWTHI